MRSLIAVLLLLVSCVGALAWYREHARGELEAARAVAPPAPPPAMRSLEERAAAAQGTVLPPQAPRFTPQQMETRAESANPDAAGSTYRCDGRIYCSQMRSCEEAKWFLQHCPGTRMDGDRYRDGDRGNGVPCERQWCKHPFSD
jgi:hypothetical protein